MNEDAGLTGAGRVSRQRWRTIVAVLLIVLGCVMAPLAGVAVWARNQVTNTDRYVRTVAPLAADPAFQATIATLGARHTFIRAGRPQTNGCVERVQQTILEECWKPAFARYLIPKQTGLKLDLERYLRYYNTQRAHTGRWTKGRTPEQVLGKAKLWHKNR